MPTNFLDRLTIIAITPTIAFIVSGCATVATDVPFAMAGPGTSKQQAIEVCYPAGQREYLRRLRCPDGSSPGFARVGNFGSRFEPPPSVPGSKSGDLMNAESRLRPGEIDKHIVDGYRVICGEYAYLVYLDMYHCGGAPPTIAPPGFSLVR